MNGFRTDEQGFTLVELMVASVVLGIIMIPLATGVILGLTKLGAASQRSSDASDSQVTSSYFVNDVQNAEVVSNSAGIAPGCAVSLSGTPTYLLELAWASDPSVTAAQDTHAFYATVDRGDGGPLQLVRVLCGPTSSRVAVLSTSVARTTVPVVTCDGTATCSATSRQINLTVTNQGQSTGAQPYVWTVTGVRRTGQ